MTFPQEKILNIDANRYCDSVGKPLNDFLLHGVHISNSKNTMKDPTKNLAKHVPKNAEIVVNYEVTLSGDLCIARGVALIPKPQYK